MRSARNAIFIVTIVILMGKYVPTYYAASQFNDYVKRAPQHNRVVPQLYQAVMEKAESYLLPVKPVDVEIKQDGGLIRLKVDYRVPVDLFVFKHELRFQASGAGLSAR
jgi:hypothetical protein